MFPKGKKIIRKILSILPLILLLPFLVAFDSLVYLLTRPACLNCGSLVEFLKGASLTAAFLAGAIGYQFKAKKNGRTRTNSGAKTKTRG